MTRIALLLAVLAAGCAAGAHSSSLDAARETARREGKRLCLVFGAKGDDQCARFERETLEDPAVAPALSKFVVVRIDAFGTAGRDATFAKLGFAGVPAVAFTTADLEVLDSRQYGPSPDEFVRVAQGVLDR